MRRVVQLTAKSVVTRLLTLLGGRADPDRTVSHGSSLLQVHVVLVVPDGPGGGRLTERVGTAEHCL